MSGATTTARPPIAHPAPAELAPPEALVEVRPAASARAAGDVQSAWWWRTLVFGWKFLFGAAMCQSPIGAVVAIGWTYRLMQRSSFKYWFKRSAHRRQTTFAQFAQSDPATAGHAHWPNWVFQQRAAHSMCAAAATPGLNRKLGAVCKAAGHSLWLNAWIGFAGIVNTWAITLAPLMLLSYAWWAGWNNSFNKGYEQAAIGPSSGLLAIFLFSIAMMFVPMAQARQAATGDWRRFFDVRFIVRLVRRHWFLTLILALLYALATLPITAWIMSVDFLGSNEPYVDMTDAQLVSYLNGFYFVATMLVVLPSFIVLRLLASKIYAYAVLKDVRRQRIAMDDLGGAERHLLARLALIDPDEPQLHPVSQGPTLTGGLAAFWRTVSLAAIWLFVGLLNYAVWFTVMSEVVVTQFFNNRLTIGWANHALIHLPWIKHIPDHLLK